MTNKHKTDVDQGTTKSLTDANPTNVGYGCLAQCKTNINYCIILQYPRQGWGETRARKTRKYAGLLIGKTQITARASRLSTFDLALSARVALVGVKWNMDIYGYQVVYL